MDLLNQNKITETITWLKSHGYVQASKIIEQYFREWNAFMNKTLTRVFTNKLFMKGLLLKNIQTKG